MHVSIYGLVWCKGILQKISLTGHIYEVESKEKKNEVTDQFWQHLTGCREQLGPKTLCVKLSLNLNFQVYLQPPLAYCSSEKWIKMMGESLWDIPIVK